MSKITRPEGLSREASAFWDKYEMEMGMIQALYIRLALEGDISGFEHLNMFVTLCSNHASVYLKAAMMATEH